MDKKQELRNKNLEGNKCNIWTLSALIRIKKNKTLFTPNRYKKNDQIMDLLLPNDGGLKSTERLKGIQPL